MSELCPVLLYTDSGAGPQTAGLWATVSAVVIAYSRRGRACLSADSCRPVATWHRGRDMGSRAVFLILLAAVDGARVAVGVRRPLLIENIFLFARVPRRSGGVHSKAVAEFAHTQQRQHAAAPNDSLSIGAWSDV